MKGTIKRVTDKFFGFITPDDDGKGGQRKDVFFHGNDLKEIAFEDLREGQKVSYDIEQAPKGPKAVNITVLAD